MFIYLEKKGLRAGGRGRAREGGGRVGRELNIGVEGRGRGRVGSGVGTDGGSVGLSWLG